MKELKQFEEEAGTKKEKGEPKVIEFAARDAEMLRKKLEKTEANEPAKEQIAVESDYEEKKEKIISKLVEAAFALGLEGSDKGIEEAMNKAKKFANLGYYDIADEVHDRILKERDERISGKID